MQRSKAALNGGYVSARAPEDLQPGELTKSIGCEYRRGDAGTLWKVPGRTRLAQPAAAAFPIFGVKVGTFDDSTKDHVFCISNNKLFAVRISDGNIVELAADLSDVRARRFLSGAHMNNKWFLTSGLNRNSVVDEDMNHREMGMLSPENALTVTPVAVSGLRIKADGESGDFLDPDHAYDDVDYSFAYATLDGNPTTPGVSPSVKSHEFTWSGTNTDTPRWVRTYIWLRPYNIPGGVEVDQPYYDSAEEVEVVVAVSENSGTDFTEVYRGNITDHPHAVIHPVTAAENEIVLSVKLIYPHDQDGDTDTSGMPVTLRVYNVEQRTGTLADTFTHDVEVKNVVAYTEWDDVNKLESGISAEADVILNGERTYELSGFVQHNPNTTHYKIYRTPFVPRYQGTGRDIAAGYKAQLGLVETIPVSRTTWSDPIEVPLDVQLPNLLEQVLIVGGSNIVPIAYDANTPPPRFQHISVFKGQLVGLYGRTLRASMPGRPESWPIPYTIDSFPLAENDTLVASYPIGDLLCIGARSVMMAIDALPRVDRNGQFTTGRLRTVADFGLVGQKAISGVSMGTDGEELVAWVSPAGIHVTNGFTSRRVTLDLDWDRELSGVDLSDSALEFNPVTMQLKFTYGDRYALLHFDPAHMKEGGQPKITWGHYGHLLDVAYAARPQPIEVSGHATDGYIYIERDGNVDESNAYDVNGRIPMHFERYLEIHGYNLRVGFAQITYRVDLAERVSVIQATSTAKMITSWPETRSITRNLALPLNGSDFWLIDRAGEGIFIDFFTDDNADFGVHNFRFDLQRQKKARERVL